MKTILLLSLMLSASRAFADLETCARGFDGMARRLDRGVKLTLALPPALEVGAWALSRLNVPYTSPLYGTVLLAGEALFAPAGFLGFAIVRMERDLAGTIREASSSTPGPAALRTAEGVNKSIDGTQFLIGNNKFGFGLDSPEFRALANAYPDRNISAQTIIDATNILIERSLLCVPGRADFEFQKYSRNLSAVLEEIAAR